MSDITRGKDFEAVESNPEPNLSVFNRKLWVEDRGFRIEGEEAGAVVTGDPHMSTEERAREQEAFEERYAKKSQ